mgnify:CR=1 FL=1
MFYHQSAIPQFNLTSNQKKNTPLSSQSPKRQFSNDLARVKSYLPIYQTSLEEKHEFWREAGEGIHWFKKWNRVLDDGHPPFYNY